MKSKLKEILLKQLQMLQEESEKARNAEDVLDRARSLSMLSEAMAKIASEAVAVTLDEEAGTHC